MNSVAIQLSDIDVLPTQSSMSSLDARFVEPDKWDELAVQFRDVIHEQTECFNALRWKPEQLERVAFYRNGVLVSAAVILIMRAPFLGTGIAVTKWGPLWRKKGEPHDVEILKQTVAKLKEVYADQRDLFFSFFPRADAEISEIEEEVFKTAGFYKGEELDSPERYFVNTGIPLEDIRASLSQKWRYNLKKSEKKGLQHRYVEGREGAREFMDLYNEMMDRKDFHDTSAVNTLEDLMEAKEEALRPVILFVEQDGEAIAAGVFDVSGERAVYLYGATRDRALALNAGYFMHWEIVKRLAADPMAKWYDLGGADTDSNLRQFKKGFVGKAGVISVTPRYYHTASNIRARIFGELLYWGRRTKGRLAVRLHKLRSSGKH